MQKRTEVKSARDRILDAAATVMREKGLANSTTKSIAAAADYSEAMLYKHFEDKQEIFLAVLKERLPAARDYLRVAGTGDLASNLVGIVGELMEFFTNSFPMAGSIFGSPDLLAQHRAALVARGGGPIGPVLTVQAYLDAERDAGRLAAACDTASAARLIVGVAFHQGFLAAFDGRDGVEHAHEKAAGAVAVLLPGLTVRS